jgi:hypothetical protein
LLQKNDFQRLLRPWLDTIDAPHTQNFEILKSLEKTQKSKKFKIIFEIFVKMLDGSILVKDAF